MKKIFFMVILFSVCQNNFGHARQSITIGSKKFTENIILGEIAAHLARDLGYDTRHREQLGGTRVLRHQEYSAQQILKNIFVP
jgi:osmoprotectant transport system permease protein